MEFITKEISRFGFQANMLAAIINEDDKNEVICLMVNGKTVRIKTPTKENATTVLNTLLYLPIVHENAGHEFNFNVLITVE